ncbi:MAG: excinuclease ABC subunit UvrC [Flammeovirgaceae bacterium]
MKVQLENIEHTLSLLPQEAGVYRFLNEDSEIIYIGKAKNLKNRVSSYFNKQGTYNRKTQKLVSEIRKIEFTVVDSEFDALLLENNLIKEHQPKYNILLKDDKTYPYICVTNEPFPRVFCTRNIEDKRQKYFGPYASIKTMHTLLDLFKQLFTLRTCTYHLSQENIEKKKFKVCLEYHLKNCKGGCEGLQSEKEYLADIQQVISILKGNLSPAKQYFKDKMMEAAEKLEFEIAETFKKKLELIQNFQNKSLIANPNIESLEVYAIVDGEEDAYVNFMGIRHGCLVETESVQIKKKLEESPAEILAFTIMDFRQKYKILSPKILTNLEVELEIPKTEIIVPKIGDLKKLIELSLKNVMYFKKERETAKIEVQKDKRKSYTLLQLKADLNLKELPHHIECFDNSNIQGSHPVAAMVCFKDGRPSKKDYRHFHVKTVVGANDFASMYEIVTRRYKRLLEEESPLPQLIVIDGGKGQLSSACQALKDLGLYGKVAIVGIAKRLEEIYYPEDSLPLHLNKKSRSLELLQKIRDEAHRFAITFHRDTRSANSLKSGLESLPSFGSITISKLLNHYKSMNGIREAGKESVIQLIGEKKANILWEYLEGKE